MSDKAIDDMDPYRAVAHHHRAMDDFIRRWMPDRDSRSFTTELCYLIHLTHMAAAEPFARSFGLSMSLQPTPPIFVPKDGK